jgi:hypothetical protein
MLSLTTPMLPIETVNWDALLPTYPYRFNGPGYLYCVRCEHFIRLVAVSNKEVLCSDCAKVLANSANHSPQRREAR